MGAIRWVMACLAGLPLIVCSEPEERGGPPAPLLEKLSSESFPERVEAQRELESWAADTDKTGLDWLLQAGTSHDDPEVRIRAFKVLRVRVMSQLDSERPGFIGITMLGSQIELDGEQLPVVDITTIQEGSPAERAGLEVGDEILGLNGERWTEGDTPDQLAQKVGGMKPGQEIELEIARSGRLKKLSLKLAPRPWAAGEWGELRRLRVFPRPGGLPEGGDEEQERERVFQNWLREQLPEPDSR